MNTLFLVVNGITLTLSIAILLVILLFDIRRSTNQLFALFIFANVMWQSGFIFLQIQSFLVFDNPIIRLAGSLSSVGFVGTNLLLYGFLVAMLNLYVHFPFRFLFFTSATIILGFTTLSSLSAPISNLPFFFYLTFSAVSLYLLWQYQQRLFPQSLRWGTILFIMGQGLLFLNLSLGLHTVGTMVASFATLVMGFALVQQDLIYPVVLRNKQLETMHDVSLAISTRVTTDALLNEIVGRATDWIGADAAVLYLAKEEELSIVAVQELPAQVLARVASEKSIAKTVLSSGKAFLIAQYYRERIAIQDELSDIADTFGSLAATPLLYDGMVIGVLVVISSRQGRVFTQDDVELLALLASQAAVAIVHDKLFNQQVLATQQLTELDRLKSELVRMTSHDLKNPLQAALANLDLLREDLINIENEDVTHSMDNIEKQLIRMQRIIGGVLDIERVKGMTKPNEVCTPHEIIENAIEETRHTAKEQQISIVYNKPTTKTTDFLGDPVLFERAIVNLIDNAIKFSKKSDTITIEIHEDKDFITFAIRDTGIGIPKEMQEKIFERFYRGQQRGAEHVSGTGLGLSLVKTVIESHHGKIYVHSNEGIGTTFFVSIPKYHPEKHYLHKEEIHE